MKTSFELAAAAAAMSLIAGTSAQQFVMYTPGGDDTAVERSDPIISPGELSAHVHQFFGSGAFKPNLNYDELVRGDCTTVGDASGNSNAQDHSVYWHPAMYAEKNDGNGYLKVPTNGHKLYYQDAGSGSKREPFEFPHGFRMIAGDPYRRAAHGDYRRDITQWVCHDSSGAKYGNDGAFPTGVSNCDSFLGLNGHIHFPHCWNGEDYNPANPHAHMAYPEGNVAHGECPSSHPTRLPHIFIENSFNLNKVADQVKPDSFVLAQGDDTGFGWHADFFNGWEDGAIPSLFECPQGNYGNHDVGTCPQFRRGSRNSNCQLRTTFHEETSNPGNNLPGCNPVSSSNPAPRLPVAGLGVATNSCGARRSVFDRAEESPIQVQHTTLVTATRTSTATVTPSAEAVHAHMHAHGHAHGRHH